MASYTAKQHEQAFCLWFTLRSYRAVAGQEGMPTSHNTVKRWAGNFDCAFGCRWHNWEALRQQVASDASEAAEKVRIAETQQRLTLSGPPPGVDGRRTAGGAVGRSAELRCALNYSLVGGCAKETGSSQNGPPNGPPRVLPQGAGNTAADLVSGVEDIQAVMSLVRTREEKLTIIRVLEGLAIERLKTLQVQQQEEARTHVPLIDMRGARTVMNLIFRTWDEERLELGNPTQIIGGEVEVQEMGIDIAGILRELDGETRRAFIYAYRRRIAESTADRG
jgi:hypothetical protein